MLYIVDGTGPADDSEYRAAMANGHCVLLKEVFGSFARYFRGPAVTGCTNLGNNAMKAIKIASFASPGFGLIVEDVFGISATTTNQKIKVLNAIANAPADDKIYLAGYSRGGATVVSIANALNKMGRKVEGLFLFDPVDSDSTLDNTNYIPPNVLRPFMAYRSMEHVHALKANADAQSRKAQGSGLNAVKDVLLANVVPGVPSFLPVNPVGVGKAANSVVGFGKQTAEALKAQWHSFRWSNLVARDFMFHCCVKGLATGASPVLPWKPRPFSGTHGAMGGCAWPRDDYPPGTNFHAVDIECVKKTREWLWECVYQTPLFQHAGGVIRSASTAAKRAG